ncbi:CoA-transferase family III domain-containing protein [Biscogniauxia marginata]|nr:CoA-transferase family III domain-containing protein [Biscogniauxia marginata]
MPSRECFASADIVREIWGHLGLPLSALASLSLPGAQDGPSTPSSFKIGHLAQSTIALSALTAALVHSSSGHDNIPTPRTSVPLRHAIAEFRSERLYTFDGAPPVSSWGTVGGLHRTADGGHVRIHDSFPNHRDGALALLGLPLDSDRAAVAEKLRNNWTALELETVAVEHHKLAIYALRSYEQWDVLPQASALPDIPVSVRRLGNTAPRRLSPARQQHPEGADRCLHGLRVLELSRVIAAPVAGKTLAAHGADVLWVTSPRLPALPALDVEFSRGKRSVSLDADDPADREELLRLVRTCDVFVQSYRPGSLASRTGLAPEDLAAANPGIVVANLSAFGPEGPWAGRRGFDSLVQTCSGMNVSEAEHYNTGRTGEQAQEKEVARPMPCQALDHGAGYLLAAGINAALYKREVEGGSYVVDVSLAGVMKYLRSLGQYEGRTGFECEDTELDKSFFETGMTGFGEMKFLKHSAHVNGCVIGWEVLPKPLGSDRAKWLT